MTTTRDMKISAAINEYIIDLADRDIPQNELLYILANIPPEPVAVPEGWKLVPVDMIENILSELDEGGPFAHDYAKSLRAMLDAAPQPEAQQPAHDLYTNSDKDRPACICDRNGDVVLGLCKRCGKAEAELDQPCVPYEKPAQALTDDVTTEEFPLVNEERELAEFEAWAKKEFPGLEVMRQNLLGTYTKTITEWLHTGWEAGRAALRGIR